MFWTFVVFSVLFMILWQLYRRYNYFPDKGVQQTAYGFLCGDILALIFRKQAFVEMVQQIYQMFPKTRYSGFYFVFEPILLIKNPDLIKQITVKDFDHFVNHQPFYPEENHPFLSRNIFHQKNEVWREMRGVVGTLFTTSKIKYMFTLIKQNGEQFVDFFLQKDRDIVVVEAKKVFTKIANDVIANVTFGTECNSLKNPDNVFYFMARNILEVEGLKRIVRVVGYHFFPKLYSFFKISPFSENPMGFFFDLVNENIKKREKYNIIRPDMINILLQARKTGLKYEDVTSVEDTGFATVKDFQKITNHKSQLTNEEITSQGYGLLFAGYETVSTLMSFMCYELALNPEIQHRLIQEVDETTEACNGELTYEAIVKMRYMDMVVSESLRKWPASIVTNRICNKPYTIEPKYPNEKPVPMEVGDVLWFAIFAIHRNPEYYPDPELFDPERFNEENRKKIKPCSFMPFGNGPRSCIAARLALIESKTVIFNILSHFEIVTVEKTPLVPKFRKQLPLDLEGGLWLGLKRRFA